MIVQSLIMIWFFIHDDIYEHAPVGELEKVHQRFLDTLKGDTANGSQDDLCKLIVAVRRVLVEDMYPGWMNRFAENLGGYLQRCKSGNPLQNGKKVP